ncbi:MAG: hypothetical protein HZB43_08415 [candidate division Zixibacteria bacterium]|nr:hypothetical protein [candidate division Zixibacteria bacterium]
MRKSVSLRMALAASCVILLAGTDAGDPARSNRELRSGLGVRATAPGLQIANSTRDFQHDDAIPHQIATNGHGNVVHFAYTFWDVIPQSLNSIDRYVHFNTYDPSSGTFLFGSNGTTMVAGGGDPMQAKAGYPTLDVDDQNRALVALHARAPDQQPSGDFSSWAIQQQSPKSSSFTQTELPQSRGTPTVWDDVIWPHVTVDQINGSPDVYHVVAHPYALSSNIVYWRFKESDVPQWRGPFIIDSCHGLSYNVAADRTTDRIALITTNDDTTASNPMALRQVSYRESADNGTSWIDGTGLGDSHRSFITSYNNPAGPQSSLDCLGDYDNSGNLHILWVELRTTGSSQCTIQHWGSSSGTTSVITNAIYDFTGPYGERPIKSANLGMGFGDGSTTCHGQSNLNYLYVTYVQFGGSPAQQNDTSAKGFPNGDIYLASSNDGGLHWYRPTNLTNTSSPGCDPATGDSCQSENWPSIARTIDDTIHIMYIADRDAGDAAYGQGSWTHNPVMYYRIPGGTDRAPICPTIAPILDASLSDANGPECEYHTDPFGPILNETLTIGNTGSGPLSGTVSVVYINPPTGSWLTVTGAGSYTIAAGAADLSFPVTMNPAGYPEGLYQAQISITHNDTLQPSPFVIPVDFFDFHVFQCVEYAVLHTKWLSLEVSNAGRLARSSPSGGLWRAPWTGSADSGNSSLRDASLLIAKTPSPDTFIYRNIYGIGNGQPGFRAQSPITMDTTRYGTNAGAATARTSFSTIDSTIGIDVQYTFPQRSDSSNLVLISYKLTNRTASPFTGLMVGEAADLDVIPSTANAQYQVDAQNTASMYSLLNLIYQQGCDTGTTSLAKKYLAGMTAIGCNPAPRAWSAPNDPYLTSRPGGGFSEGYLYQQMVKSGLEIIPSAWDPGVDRHSVMVFETNATLSPSDAKHYMLGFVTSTVGPSDADLIATTKKAWKYAFGWQDIVTTATITEDVAWSYRYWALGSHEYGVASGCCGCVVTKVSGSPKITITPDADNCTGTINFPAGSSAGEYTATFRVTTPTCGGPVYTDDHVVRIIRAFIDGCPNQGDVANNDGRVDVFDVIQMIAIAFSGAPNIQDPHCPVTRGDVNCDTTTDVFDVILEIAIAFSGGSPCNPFPG